MAFLKLSSDVLREHKGKSFVGVTTAFLCHDGNGRIFFAKRSKNTRDEHGRWDAGGGGLKFGETLEGNMEREIMEEYGCKVLKSDFIGYFDAFRELPDGTPTHWLAMCFAALVNPDEVSIQEPDMFDDSGWFTLDNLPQPIHSQFGVFMEKHGDRLRAILAERP